MSGIIVAHLIVAQLYTIKYVPKGKRFQILLCLTYEGVSKSFRTGRLKRERQMIQLSATMRSCVAILWVSLVSFAAITLCVASQQVIPKVSVYFFIGSVRKLLDTPSYIRCVFTYSMVQDIILKADCHPTCQKISHLLIEPEGSLPCLHKSATGPYPESAESSSPNDPYLPKVHLNVILPPTPRLLGVYTLFYSRHTYSIKWVLY
jgi:hypothetical protein